MPAERAAGLRHLPWLASLPMLGAVAGGWLDERLHLGFTVWRAACRSAGLRLGSLVEFTLQLMPLAVMGLLLGGLILLVAAAVRRTRDTRHYLAAHAGCALSLPAGLVLCASTLPLPLMLVADAAVAALAALGMLWLMRPRARPTAAHP